VEFTTHVIAVGEANDINRILKSISSLRGFAVVNIAPSSEMKSVLFCEENLHAILAGTPTALYLEVLPQAQYKGLVRDKIDQMEQAAASLRAILRAHYVSDLSDQIREFLHQMEQLVMMLGCHALQNPESGLSAKIGLLQDILKQLVASSTEPGDNVSCMDCLQYKILPALKILRKVFR